MNKEKLNLIFSVTLILTIGLIIGYTMGFFRGTRSCFPEFRIVDDVNPGIATIKLMQAKNGKLYGEVAGQKARLVYRADGILELDKGASFEIPVSQITLKDYYQARTIPENAQFVASKNGKYYYSVFDKRGLNLKLETRLYFSSASQAEEMGYLKK